MFTLAIKEPPKACLPGGSVIRVLDPRRRIIASSRHGVNPSLAKLATCGCNKCRQSAPVPLARKQFRAVPLIGHGPQEAVGRRVCAAACLPHGNPRGPLPSAGCDWRVRRNEAERYNGYVACRRCERHEAARRRELTPTRRRPARTHSIRQAVALNRGRNGEMPESPIPILWRRYLMIPGSLGSLRPRLSATLDDVWKDGENTIERETHGSQEETGTRHQPIFS